MMNASTTDSKVESREGTSTPLVLVLQMGLNSNVSGVFGRIMSRYGCNVEAVKIAEGESPLKSDWNDYDGILLTGSSFMVTDKHDWSVRTGQTIRKVVEAGITPVFGVCYGHQLLVDALGGRVEYAAKRQIGSKSCELTAAAKSDPLFSVFQDRESLIVQVLHRQLVTTIPPTATVLATNDIDKYHALRLGERCWSVQFHPELQPPNIRAVIEFGKSTLPKDGLDYDTVMNTVRESDDGSMILKKFTDACRARMRERLSSIHKL